MHPILYKFDRIPHPQFEVYIRMRHVFTKNPSLLQIRFDRISFVNHAGLFGVSISAKVT